MDIFSGYVTLRKIQSSDLNRVVLIANSLFTEQYTLDFFLHMWEIAPDTFLVAECHREVIGFILAVNNDIDSARILMLSITQGHQGKGIGSSLLRMLLERMDYQVKKISLEVRMDNTPAILFYRHHGFQITGYLKHFYSDGSDGYLMEKIQW
jgi:ribosomal-protein-alanine N-acetyltransferase